MASGGVFQEVTVAWNLNEKNECGREELEMECSARTEWV